MPIIPKPLSIKITSHTQNQTVPANKPLKISGISSDNVNSNCTVYADWNDQKLLQQVTPQDLMGQMTIQTGPSLILQLPCYN